MTDYPIAANAALHDPAQTEAYLSMLFRHVDWEEGQLISLLGIGEKGTPQEDVNGKGPFKERKIVPPAFIGAAHGHLKRWAGHHIAAFIVPAVLHGEAGEKNDVTLDKVAALTAIILDIDNGDIDAKAAFVISRLGQPTMIVASGGSTDEGKVKRHFYWLLNEPSDEVERVATLRKQLAVKVGGDQSFGRATQVIRIPGSVHAKGGHPNRCFIIEKHDIDYSLDDLAEVIETMEPMPGVELKPEGPALPLTDGGFMDFSPRHDTAMVALHRDVHAGGDELTRWGEFSKVAGFQIQEARAGRVTPEQAYSNTYGWMIQHMIPPWPDGRFDQEFQALVRKDIENHGAFPVVAAARLAPESPILPTPATFPPPGAIPPRPWLFGRWLQRGIVTAMIAPGGVGKSSLVAAMGLSLVSGKPMLGKHVYGGPLRVWSWNLEDSHDNLARARVAASLHYGVGEADCGDRLFVDSGPDGATLCTAVEDRAGFTIIEPVMEALEVAIGNLKLDVLFIDPFVSSHAVNENDNNKIDAIAKRWARVAHVTNCAVVLIHHSSKMRGEVVTAESARGAGALNNAARMTLVLNRMSADQADSWGIDGADAIRYFSVSDDKHNLSAAERADWFHIVSVDLDNGTDILPSDNVGVVTPWKPPEVLDGVHVDDLYQIQCALNRGTYWADKQSKKSWAGEVVGNVLKIDVTEKKGKERAHEMLKLWLKTGAIKPEMRRDEEGNRNMRQCLVPGNWVTPVNRMPPGGAEG